MQFEIISPKTKGEVLCLNRYRRCPFQARKGRATSPQHKALRAKIMLLAEKKLSTEAIMKELNTSKNTVVKWRKRFCKDRLDGLKDEQRPGRPRIHGAEVRLKIATDARRPPETITHWSTRELAQRLSEQGIIELWFSIYGRKIIKRGGLQFKRRPCSKDP